MDPVFRALADPTRRGLLDELFRADGQTLSALERRLTMSRFGVMKHLKVLEEAGLVTRSRDAQRRPVHLETEVFDLMTKWIERYRLRAEERYSRLDAVLADLDRPATTPPAPEEGTAS
jgi:DNA-binding transcriptional ArsR family regulator